MRVKAILQELTEEVPHRCPRHDRTNLPHT
jgi:hypothetical protein